MENCQSVQKKHYYETYVTAKYQIDTYILFIERIKKLTKQKANFALIIPNSWLNNLKLIDVRKCIFTNYKVNQFVKIPNGAPVNCIYFLNLSMAKNKQFKFQFNLIIANLQSF